MERLGRAVRTTGAAGSMTCGRLYFCDVLLERLAQDLRDVTPTLWEFTQKEHAVVCEWHLARPRHLAATDQPHSGDRVMGGAAGARRDPGGAGTGGAVVRTPAPRQGRRAGT
jgi:hypothetical protein